ncbi:MAG TPA: ChbG/HpnK family deacetylase [Acidimicrobiia bacterium]
MSRLNVLERLGEPADAKLVIVNCDDLGSTIAANRAIYELLREGLASSASIMVPCAAARDAAQRYGGEDVGVHLTLTSEWDHPRWGPVSGGTSLRLADGSLHRTAEEVWRASDPEQVRTECRAQVRQALSWGIDVTHLDCHMHTLFLDPDLGKVYVDVAAEFGLPARLTSRASRRRLGPVPVPRRPQVVRHRAEVRGVLAPDRLVWGDFPARGAVLDSLGGLRPGVTELYLHPTTQVDGDDVQLPDHEDRLDDYEFLASGELRRALDEIGARVIGYRELRDLQRSL